VENGVEDNAYRIPNDDMTIGTVKFDKLHYIFNDKESFHAGRPGLPGRYGIHS
jgi:hypothetical protein